MKNKPEILQYLQTHSLSVLSTVGNNSKPESAVMAFIAQSDFTFLMFTEKQSRKWQNFTVNSQASMVVGGLNDDPSVQLDGKIQVLDKERGETAKKQALSLHPEWSEYFSSPTGAWFAFTPTWLRYLDFSKSPPETVEIENL